MAKVARDGRAWLPSVHMRSAGSGIELLLVGRSKPNAASTVCGAGFRFANGCSFFDFASAQWPGIAFTNRSWHSSKDAPWTQISYSTHWATSAGQLPAASGRTRTVNDCGIVWGSVSETQIPRDRAAFYKNRHREWGGFVGTLPDYPVQSSSATTSAMLQTVSDTPASMAGVTRRD